MKKLSSLTEQNRDKLVADLNSLNLTKYIEEVVNAICSAKLKVCLFVRLCVCFSVFRFQCTTNVSRTYIQASELGLALMLMLFCFLYVCRLVS